MKRALLAFFILLGMAGGVFAQTPAIHVDATESRGAINPLVYGTNYGPWSIVPLEFYPQFSASGLELIRFPGGNWGDRNDIQPFQLGIYQSFLELSGAEGAISVRLLNGSPEQAADLVRLVNVERGMNIRYWSIGNEPNLFPDDYTIDQFNQDWRAFAEAMQAVDPDIILVGPEISQYPPDYESINHSGTRDSSGRLWLHEFLRANGDMVDIVSVHRYPFPLGITAGPASVDIMRNNPPEWERMMINLRATINEIVGHDLPIAVTELNSYWAPTSNAETTPDSFYNAIWFADVLGRLINQQVSMVGQFSLQSNAGIGGWGLFGAFDIRPTYYVYQIYQRFGDERLTATSDMQYLSAYAARRDDGTLTLIVVNLGDDAATVPVEFTGFEVTGSPEVWLFDETHQAEQISYEELATDNNDYSFPPRSISLLIFSA